MKRTTGIKQFALGLQPPAGPVIVRRKTAVFVRHGSYDEDKFRIDEQGAREMAALASKLAPYIKGKKIVLITSLAPRAVDSALELVRLLKLKRFEAYAEFWSDNQHLQDDEAALALMQFAWWKHDDADVLIVVTHLEYSSSLPVRYAREVGRAKIEWKELEKGQARIIDFVGGKVTDLIIE